MTEPFYERLSALDASFLGSETEDAQMHSGALCLFDARPLTNGSGVLDSERIGQAIQSMLDKNPRMRQKIWRPTGGPPLWIDDPDFQLSFHLRHTALPYPGSTRQLRRLAARVLSQTLDFGRPLWEIWIIEGVERERFALLTKLHRSLADGIRARELLTSGLSVAPHRDAPTPYVWNARPAPGLARLQLDAVRRRVQSPASLLRSTQKLLAAESLRESLGDAAQQLSGAWSRLVSPVVPSPLNRPIGPHRRIETTRCEFETVQGIRKAAGGKVNDVVLACVTGALRRFLLARKLPVEDLDFRVLVPVSEPGDPDAGDRPLSQLNVPIPLGEIDPLRRLQRIAALTEKLKATRPFETAELLARLSNWTGFPVPRGLVRRARSQQLLSNLVVAQVPGPMFPLYLLESPLLEAFPLLPLSANQALAVALYTYNGTMHWGFHADWEAVPDLHDFVRAIDVELAELVRASTPMVVEPPPPLRVAAAEGAEDDRTEFLPASSATDPAEEADATEESPSNGVAEDGPEPGKQAMKRKKKSRASDATPSLG